MTALPVPLAPPPLPARPPLDLQRLLNAFLSGRSPQTIRAYRQDLQAFAAFLVADPHQPTSGRDPLLEAAALLLGRSHGEANALALDFRAHLLGQKLSPATVNRRLAALRSLVKLGRVLGLVGWELDVAGVRSQSYRDTRGPGHENVQRMLARLAAGTGAKAVRDRAIVRLLYDLGLRRGEVARLDCADVCTDPVALLILGKGRQEKEHVTLPGPTAAAVAAWLAARPAGGQALFVSLDRAHAGHRLTGTAIYAMIRELGDALGVRARPHGLRHSSITRALDLFHGDVRKVQRHSRHKKLETLMLYDDRRRDESADVAARLAGESGDG